jgi:hypothetical protein
LLQWRTAIIQKLAGLRLTLHENQAQVYPVATGIPFLGFRVFPTHRRVKRRKIVHFRRKLRQMYLAYANQTLPFDRLDASVQGWINHVRYGDTWGLRRAMFQISGFGSSPRFSFCRTIL